MAETNLERLARLARSGGRREMEALLHELRPLVCRWALVWTGSPDTADDIAQRVLINVHRSIGESSPEGAVTTWVYRITRNALIDDDRKVAQDERLRDGLKLARLVQNLGAHDRTNGDMRTVLLRLMHELSPRQRAVFDLVDLQGFEATSAAEMLDLAPATVRVHLHRARQALRDLCQEHGLYPATPETKDEVQ